MQWNVSALLQLIFEFSERQWVNITIALMPTLGILLQKKKAIFIHHIFLFSSSAKENSLSAQSTTPAQTQRAKFSRVVMPIFLSY